MKSAPLARTAILAILSSAAAAPAQSQDIEPRAYVNAPVGMNILVTGLAYTRGGVSIDPAIALTDASIKTENAFTAYARVLDLWGKNGSIELVLPYTHLSGSALYDGQPVERSISGFANPAMRLAVNLYGAPALSIKEFAGWQQDLIIGASLRISAPWSQYDPTKLVNIGTNRWYYKPEIAASQAVGPWTFELATAVTFYTDNTDFYGGNTRSQDPLYATQGHVIRNFGRGGWASFDATYYTGGRSMLNGTLKNDLQQNWRIGATLSLPIDRNNGIRLYASSGVSARTGNNFDLIGAAWQYRWIAGF